MPSSASSDTPDRSGRSGRSGWSDRSDRSGQRRRGIGWTATGAAITIATGGYWAFFSPYAQCFGPFPYRGVTEEKVVALTFDDGPNEPFTTQIADMLGARGIAATFFQVGACVERYPEVTARLVRDGHEIGSHSYSHRFSHCFRWSRQRPDLERGRHALSAVLGTTPTLFRPPWLFRHPRMLRFLRSQGMVPVSGQFAHAFEVFQPSPERMAHRALAKTAPGAILIFHDGLDARTGERHRTVEAVELVADALLAQGYRFVTVSRLLGVAEPRSGHPGRPIPAVDP